MEKRANRISTTYSIEGTLDRYCRADCPHYSNATMCNNSCPIGQQLIAYGGQLGGIEEKFVCIKWTETDINNLITCLDQNMKYRAISTSIGRTYGAIKAKVRELRSEGRIS